MPGRGGKLTPLPLPYRYVDFLTEIGEQAVALGLPLRDSVRSFVDAMVTAALLRTGNNKSKAALLLGIHRNSLIKLLGRTRPSGSITKVHL